MSEYREAAGSYSTSEMVRDLWTRVSPYKGKFFFATAVRAVSDIAWLYPSIAVAVLITELAKGTQASEEIILTTFLYLIVATIIYAFLQPGSRLWGFWVSEQAKLDTERHALAHLAELDMAWHEKGTSGAKIKRIYNAASGVDRLIRLWFNVLIKIVINILGITYILSTIDMTVTVIVIVFIVTYFPIAFLMGRRVALTSLEVNKEEELLSGIVYETVANVRTVKILGRAQDILGRVDEAIVSLMKKIFSRIFTYQVRNAVIFLWKQGFNIGTLIFIALGIMSGHYEIGLFVLFYRFFGQISESVGELAEFSQEFMTAKLALARLAEVLHTRPEGEDVATASMPLLWQEIRFENVSFSYGDTEALSNISFILKRGQKIGIVGSSGAGKSTLFKLLLKERVNYSGEIYVDTVPLRTISRSAYFERVSAVLQDTEVFNLSLKNNILLSRSGPERAEVFAGALSTAHVTEFAERLPEGVDTIIGEKGVKLSGGERQRLGIARAIYKEPELLLMDEATSHLDSESEERIQDSLARFFSGVTALVIAHRLSTIRAMDTILVIEGGTIVEQGTFDELIGKAGRFSELWEKQKL